MNTVIAMLLVFVVLGLTAKKPDARISLVVLLMIVAYVGYAYVSG